MGISAKILLDSLAPCGARLVTWELKYPRFIHQEVLTHRQFSRNAASSRAIPVTKMLKLVEEHPALPVYWGKNQSGMQAKLELSPEEIEKVKALWLEARDSAVKYARQLIDLGLHKQITNRILEPWVPYTIIASSTSHRNLFKLRDHPDAQPEFQVLARIMHKAFDAHRPTPLADGEWHLPLIFEEDREQFPIEDLIKISTGRCARVSYLTHDGVRDPQEDIALHDKLVSKEPGEPIHASPAEHVAQASSAWVRSGNFVGFRQYRKMLANECAPEYDNEVPKA